METQRTGHPACSGDTQSTGCLHPAQDNGDTTQQLGARVGSTGCLHPARDNVDTQDLGARVGGGVQYVSSLN